MKAWGGRLSSRKSYVGKGEGRDCQYKTVPTTVKNECEKRKTVKPLKLFLFHCAGVLNTPHVTFIHRTLPRSRPPSCSSSGLLVGPTSQSSAILQ